MNLESNQLSLEQQFIHEVFVSKIQNLSYEETKELLIKFHKHTLFKDNYYEKQFCAQGAQGHQTVQNQKEQNN